MKHKTLGEFIAKSSFYNRRHPDSGLFELTYRCNLNCVHCYCQGMEDTDKELSTVEVKDIVDQIHKAGCLSLVLSGGEPLLRDDFEEIYLYIKRKGFLITLFTNGTLLGEERQKFLQKYPPFSLEITVNGVDRETYESITRTEGSFEMMMTHLKELADRGIPLSIKANCLKQNKNQIAKIKAFSEKLLGAKKFKFDPYIYPRLNRDPAPIQHRLSPHELNEIFKSDPKIYAEYKAKLSAEHHFKRSREFLYQCNSWAGQFFITPYGKLRFCEFSEKFSTDLKEGSFQQGFYEKFSKILEEKFKSNSKCKECALKTHCLHCPARAYLETGDEEAPVPYYCALAEDFVRQKTSISEVNSSANLQDT